LNRPAFKTQNYYEPLPNKKIWKEKENFENEEHNEEEKENENKGRYQLEHDKN